MPTMGTINVTKFVKQARDAAEMARREMFAAFAQLQLDVQATHQQNWDSVSVRNLEDKIDAFKASCQTYRAAEDAIVVAMSMGGDRVDTDVPAPNELTKNDIPPGWHYEFQNGTPVLVPDPDNV